MTGEDFVKAIERVVRDAAVSDSLESLERPSGRRPDQIVVAQSEWYRSLGPQEQQLLKGVLQRAIDNAIFGLLCVLDSVRAVEDGVVKGDFVLNYVNRTSTPLNGLDLPMLHDLYVGC